VTFSQKHRIALGGWIALRLTGFLNWLFAALASGLIVFGVTLATTVKSGTWFDRQ
jgi:hypothetical protein